MQIYLFRHGETEWNKALRLQGQSDIPLNEAGRRLAVQTGQALKGISFDRAFCSTLHRARETARLMIGDRPIPLEADERLKEMCFGSFEGDFFDNVKKEDAGHPLYDFFCRPECYVPPAGAESFQDIIERGGAFMKEKIMPLEGICENVLIVAHGALNRGILCAVGELSLERFWRFKLSNCAATILSLEGKTFRIVEPSMILTN